MAFKLIYHSQTDPQWTNDRLGFGDPGDTIGKFGCALTSVAMLLSGHGYAETPATLNRKLQNKQGFQSSLIRWGVVCEVHPQVKLRQVVDCRNSDAPLAQIDAALAAGQPVVVLVDNDRDPDLDWHYVLLYARKGDDYLMLDPIPYQPGTTKEDFLRKRYGYDRPLKRVIHQVLFYEAAGSGGPVTAPSSTPTTTPQTQPTGAPAPTSGVYARVMDTVTLGLNIRSSTDTSSLANLVVNVPSGTQLLLLDPDGASKIGQSNQWVRVREPGGREGLAAAWFLEKAAVSTPAPIAEPAPLPVSEAPVSPSSTPGTAPPSTPAAPPKDKLTLVVSEAVGSSGLRLRKTPSKGGTLVMVLQAGTKLTVVEPVEKAKNKLGKVNQWILVREPNGKRGYVGAEFVKPG
jgi:hypothetical protein